jgi:RimJ/RimL family protein N-acetyltransferase
MQIIKGTSMSSKSLLIVPLCTNDSLFILELFNTPGWLRFIGDRNMKSLIDASTFIDKYLADKNAAIWVFYAKENRTTPLGIITLIKRYLLDFPDIGYALLPEYMHQGLASEATLAILDFIKDEKLFHKIYAMSLPENIASVNLLKKLNFVYEKEILEKNELLHIYCLKIPE